MTNLTRVVKPKVSFKNLPDTSNARVGFVAQKGKIYFSFGKDAKIQNTRSTFVDKADLINYLITLLGVSKDKEGELQFSVHRKGQYQKVSKSGKQVFSTGDPILDLITDDNGTLVLEGKSYDFKSPGNSRAIVEVTDTRETKRFVDEATGKSITFHAWKKSHRGIYFSMGCEITTAGGPFEQAQINSQYGKKNLYLGGCDVVKIDDDEDANDSYLDEYESKFFSSPYDGVRSACSAIWQNQIISGFVQAGSICDDWSSPPPRADEFSGWNTSVKIPNLKSKAGPALVEFNNRLHMLFIGVSSNDIFHWVFDGSSWSPAIGTTGKIPGQSSKTTPAVAVFNNRIHMVHLGNTATDIWYSTFNGVQWTTNVETGQKSIDTPALIVHAGTLHMVHIASDSKKLLHRVLNGSRWEAKGPNNGVIPNQSSKAGPTLASGSNLMMLHLGDTANDIWYSYFDGNQWSNNVLIGKKSSAAPVLFEGKLVHIGNGSTTLWEADFVGPFWSPSKKIPGQSTADTPALAKYDGRLYMVRRGNIPYELWMSSYGRTTPFDPVTAVKSNPGNAKRLKANPE